MVLDLKQLPVWFLVFLVFAFGTYFAVTMKSFLAKISAFMEDHEKRLSHLEGEHQGFRTLHDRREHKDGR